MKLSNEMMAALNKQVEGEQKSYMIYFCMANWFAEKNLLGWEKLFRKYAYEELEHADKLSKFITDNEGHVTCPNSLSYEDVKTEFTGIYEILTLSLQHEEEVTMFFNELKKLADSMNDYTTSHFLNWYLDEQVEEEEKFRTLIAELEIGSNNVAVTMMNEQFKHGRRMSL